jgi:hypothetical protein
MTRQHYVVARAASWLNVLPRTGHSGALPLRPPTAPIVTLTKVTIVASFAVLGGLFWASGMIEARVPSAGGTSKR